MGYGEQHQVYGAGSCPHCHQVHPRREQIPETPRTRFMLLQFMAEMSTSFAPGKQNWVKIDAGKTQKFMMGLLVSGNSILVAISGNNQNNTPFNRVAKLKGYTVCPPRSAHLGINLSAANRVIPPLQYDSTRAVNATAAGNCAAPRLIQYALSQPAFAANIGDWEMSEMMYQPKTSRRLRDNMPWVHGLSAPHCETCEKLVPLLMCPVP